MFDQLVESNKNNQRGRTGRFFLLTGTFYAALLAVCALWAILGFRSTLAEELSLTAIIAPPPPIAAAPTIERRAQPQPARNAPAVVDTFSVPKKIMEIADASVIEKYRTLTHVNNFGTSCTHCTPIGDPHGVAGMPSALADAGAPPEPPPPPVKVKPTPEPTPTPHLAPQRRSEGVIQGMAIRKVAPQYPPIAKAARTQGPVQVQILISEEGRVLSTDVLSGHPLLREAALNAARQWVFRPTLLTNVPVKVQGVLTFNFTLN